MNNVLHVYSQRQWHDDAYIVGDKESLQLLADAINKAISSGEGACQSCVNDGEGFDVHIRRVDDPQLLDKLAVPYTSDVAEEKDSAAIWPWILFNMRQGNKSEKRSRERNAKKKLATRLWKMIGDIPIDEDECVEEPFSHPPIVDFPEGTDRQDIWHWFEETFDVSVHSLMYPGKGKPCIPRKRHI